MGTGSFLITKFNESTRIASFNKLKNCFTHYFFKIKSACHCTARQCSPLRRKFMECYIIKPAQSLSMEHLVIGQRQKAPDFSAFHWSPHGSLVSIGQHFVIIRVVHLPKRTETTLITESDLFGPIRFLSLFRTLSPNRTRLFGPCIAG